MAPLGQLRAWYPSARTMRLTMTRSVIHDQDERSGIQRQDVGIIVRASGLPVAVSGAVRPSPRRGAVRCTAGKLEG